jgi:hypothetical protein
MIPAVPGATATVDRPSATFNGVVSGRPDGTPRSEIVRPPR